MSTRKSRAACARELLAAIPTTYADALERLLAEAHEDGYKMKGEIALARQERLIAKARLEEAEWWHEHVCDHAFMAHRVNHSNECCMACEQLAELRRAADVAGNAEGNEEDKKS